MAKRARGSHRPGQRPPLQRTSSRPAPAPNSAAAAPVASRPSTLTPEEEERAAELEAQIVAEERAADEARRRTGDRRRSGTSDVAVAPRAAGGLAVRAADEYAYVGRDVKRITLIGGGMIALMIVLWLVLNATGAGTI